MKMMMRDCRKKGDSWLSSQTLHRGCCRLPAVSVVFLVAGLVLSPIWSALHLSISRHTHRYDSVHGQFLDVIIKGDLDAQSDSCSASSCLDLPDRQVLLRPCAVANVFWLNHIAGSMEIATSVRPLYEEIIGDHGDLTSFYPCVLHLAPKQSPPTEASA